MNQPSTFAELVAGFINLLSLFIPVIFAITFVFVAWKIILAWIIKGGDENAVAEGKQVALAAVIAFVLMFGVWGLLAVLQRAFLGM